MKTFVLFCVLSFSFQVFGKMVCSRDGVTISAEQNIHMGGGPSFYNVQVNGDPEGGLELFSQILTDSKKCVDLRTYTSGVESSEVLLCEGEMFAPNAAYGQVIMSVGGPAVFANDIATFSWWNCSFDL